MRGVSRWPLGLLLPLMISGLGSGCDENKGAEPTAPEPTAEEGCLTTEAYFSRKVWWPVLSTNCIACHTAQGAAKDSKLVLQSSWQTGFLQTNLERFRNVAAFETEGLSIMLRKPLGELEHGGGARFDASSDEYKALEQMVSRLSNPVVCESNEGSDFFTEVQLLGPKATLRKATLNLVGRLPTAEEYTAAAGGDIASMEKVLDDVLDEPAFYARLKEMWNDRLLTDRYLGGENAINLLSDDDFANRRWYRAIEDNDSLRSRLQGLSNTAVAREPLELIAHVVRNDRPFGEILTADYILVNPFSARTYGESMGAYADGADPDDYDASSFVEARLPNIPHAGVLTSAVFLNRFPTTATNVNRHRSRMVYELFLTTDVMRLAERPVDPTEIEDFNPTLYNPACAVCHAVIDPVGGAFQNWNSNGRYRPPEMGWFPDLRPPGFAGKTIPHAGRRNSLQWLSKEIAADRRFASATVHAMLEALTGHQPLRPPLAIATEADRAQLRAFEAQSELFDGIVKRFQAEDQNLKSVIKGLVMTPYFRAVTVQGQRPGPELANLGTGRLLTPELLDRKIRAVTGQRWTRNGRNVLLSTSEFRIFYGGIDSNQITKRITQPNGIMASIALRMANEMSCRVTARDFVRNPAERLLFPHVETAYVPRDDNGFEVPEAVAAIKRNIQHLHLRILGEELASDDPELDRTYRLFEETWLEGRAGLDVAAYSNNLAGECQATVHPDTDERLDNDERITTDPNYTVRAWIAVMTYLMSDWAFLYE